MPSLSATIRLDHLAGGRIGNADHAGLGDGRMLHQRAFHFERTDEMAGALDDVVGAADEPIVALAVPHREIAGEIPAADETFAIALLFIEVGAHHRRPARPQRELAHGHRLGDFADARRPSTRSTMPAVDARQRPAHRARLHVHRQVIGDHDAAGLGLPPVVVERLAERLTAPHHGFGIERLADARHKTQL